MEDIASVDVPEIEVTPEMIEAGVGALQQFDLVMVSEGWDSKGEVVRAVLDAAFRVSQEDRRSIGASLESHRISLPYALAKMILI